MMRVTIGSTADREPRVLKWRPFRAIAVNRTVIRLKCNFALPSRNSRYD